MTKSKMRAYTSREYSDHEVDLFMTVDLEDVARLHINMSHEEFSLPADDILEALQPRVYEIVYDHFQRALSND